LPTVTVATPRGPAPRASGLQSSRAHFQVHADFRALSLQTPGRGPPDGNRGRGNVPVPGQIGDRDRDRDRDRGSAPCQCPGGPGRAPGSGRMLNFKIEVLGRSASSGSGRAHEAPSLTGRCQWLRSSYRLRVGPPGIMLGYVGGDVSLPLGLPRYRAEDGQ
jgi:hypothetical protein